MRLRCGEAVVGARQIALAHSIVSLHQLTAHTARRLNRQCIGSLITLTGSGHCSLHRHRLIAHCIGLLCIRASAHYRLHRLTRLLTASACCVGSLDGSLRRLFMWCVSVHCSVLGDAGPASVRPGLSCSHLPLIMPEQDTRLDSLACSAAASVQREDGRPTEPGGGTGCFGNLS